MIDIIINDQTQNLPRGITLAEVIDQFSTQAFVVAAVNETFVPQSRHRDYILQSGDRVELLGPMEGG